VPNKLALSHLFISYVLHGIRVLKQKVKLALLTTAYTI
jgi:hypothetical protein